MPDIRPALESVSRRIKVEVEDLFLKFHLGASFDFCQIYAGKPVWGSDQTLAPRDGMLLLALMQQTHPMTGRISCSVSELARKCGKTLSAVQESISRLKKARLVVNSQCRETGAYYMLINPALVSIGSEMGGKRKKLYNQFYAVLSEELSIEDPATVQAT
jgi:predicted transcriptional regulator